MWSKHAWFDEPSLRSQEVRFYRTKTQYTGADDGKYKDEDYTKPILPLPKGIAFGRCIRTASDTAFGRLGRYCHR
jgi:hypothetical protein